MVTSQVDRVNSLYMYMQVNLQGFLRVVSLSMRELVTNKHIHTHLWGMLCSIVLFLSSAATLDASDVLVMEASGVTASRNRLKWYTLQDYTSFPKLFSLK